MNSYLEIAEKILLKSKTPLTAKEILDAAYRNQIVPPHLFGKTQHKTLQARLSEDVLYNKNKTVFIRTGPGRFALRPDKPIENHFGNRYIAPLRAYQLKKFEVICALRDELNHRTSAGLVHCHFRDVIDLFTYKMPLLLAEQDDTYLPLRILVTIHHADLILCLAGESETDLGFSRSLGLFGYLKDSDADLFSTDLLGIDNAARRIISEQTKASSHEIERLLQSDGLDSLAFVHLSKQGPIERTALVISAYECIDPDTIIESIPSYRAPRWTKALSGINNLDALDDLTRQLACEQGLLEIIAGTRPR